MAADKLKWRVNRAVRDSRLPAPARLIMFVLSDRANADTGVIPDNNSPSLKDLAHDTGLNKATIARQLPELERLGWVVCGRPNAVERASHATTTYRIQIGSEVAECDLESDASESHSATPPRSQSATSKEDPRSQSATGEVAECDFARSQSATSYIKDDDHYDLDDRFATEAAQPPVQTAKVPAQRKRPGGTRKAAKAKERDEFDPAAQELTVAFFERYKGRNVQTFPAVRGVVKNALKEGVPRDVLAHAMDAVVNSGFAISGTTLSTELTRMWNAANGNGTGRRPSAAQQRIAEGLERQERMRLRDEAEARGEHVAGLLALPPGRTA